MLALAAACSRAPGTRAPGTPDQPGLPLSGDGPRPGPLRTAWQVHTPYAAQGAALDLVGGRVLVTATLPDGVVARDPRTGRVRWRHREPGMDLTTYGVTGGTVVVRSQSRTADAKPGPENPSPWAVRLVGLDALDGRQLWRRDELAVQAVYPFRALAGGGTIATWQRDGRRCDLAGADARTGRPRWAAKVQVGGDCLPGWTTDHDTDGSLFLARDQAGGLHAIDPATGRTLWSRRLSRTPAEQPEVTVRQGVVLVVKRFEASWVELIDTSGRKLFEIRGGDPCRWTCGLAVLGDRAVVSHLDAAGRPCVTVADRHGGAPAMVSAPGAYPTLVPASGGVYGLRLWPTPGLDVIDPAAQRVRSGPAPPGVRLQGANWQEDGVTWLAVGGGRVFVADAGVDGRTAITSAAGG